MRRLVALAILLTSFATTPLAAQTFVTTTVTVEEYVEEAPGNGRFVGAQPDQALDLPRGISTFGPFRVIDATHVALVGATDQYSPVQFQAMLAAYPKIAILEMIECPGTEDDGANLRLGRMIREHGLATHVPANGSVRSGAVELFLAGLRRQAEAGSEFAVHAWADDRGLEPKDFAADAPENRHYLDYYRDMGMTEAEARAFYAMTNSVPNADARWLTAGEMAQWVRMDGSAPSKVDARVDSGLALN